MATDRNEIMSALFARLQTALAGSIKGSDRRFLGWENFTATQLPAMVVSSKGGTVVNPPGLPSKNTVEAWVIFYARAAKTTDSPETILFNLLAGVETALLRQPGEIANPDDDGTTLGGLVFTCWVTGYEVHQEFGQDLAAISISISMLSI